MSVPHHNLDWKKPLVKQAASWLLARQPGNFDLSSSWIVVPTRQAGRRLREALALLAAAEGRALAAPKVTPPEALLRALGGGDSPELADKTALLHAFITTLQKIDAAKVAALFPSSLPLGDFDWAMGTAKQLIQLQSALGESGLSFSTVAEHPALPPGERERWKALALLEQTVEEMLAKAKLTHPQSFKSAIAARPVSPEGITGIVLLGCPDPLPMLIQALDRLANVIELTVVTYGPDEPGAFDPWGIPQTESWLKRNLFQSPTVDKAVLLHADPVAMARSCRDQLARLDQPDSLAVIGITQPAWLPLFLGVLREGNIPAYNPSGKPAASHELCQLLGLLARIAGDADFDTLGRFIRIPAVAYALIENTAFQSLPQFLKTWDDFRNRHLPGDLKTARQLISSDQHDGLGKVCESLDTLITRLRKECLDTVLQELLGQIYSRESFNPHDPEEATWLQLADTLNALLIKHGHTDDLTCTERLTLLHTVLSETSLEEERPDHAVELPGWIELLWEDAPYLMLAGANDGLIPESTRGDALLPDSLRTALGLPDNARRHARDAYLMAALLPSRAPDRIILHLPRHDLNGEPLRPSALLLQGSEADLPARVKTLFKKIPPAMTPPAPSPQWKLRLPQRRWEGQSISASALADYLRCPFRFYLSRVIGMSPYDPRKEEMDAADFGTIIHDVLKDYADERSLHAVEDPGPIIAFLEDKLSRNLTARYGPQRSAPLLFQEESARERLRSFAFIQAGEQQKGWRIEYAEIPLAEIHPLTIATLPVSGIIDRIDCHTTSGERRIIDYKTADKPGNPRDKHIASIKRGHTAPAYAAFSDKEMWIGLQLPLYLQALRGRNPNAVTCGYINLSRSVADSGLALWDLSEEEMQKAIECAAMIVHGLQSQYFWPPNKVTDYPPFDDLLGNDPASMVDEATRPLSWPPSS